MRFRGRWAGKCAAFVVMVLAVLSLLSYVVMRLWNALIPELFHGPSLGFWQAAGLLVLCKILFGGFRGRHGGWREHHRWKRQMWREKWSQLTPAERERLRGKFKGRWCGGGWDSQETDHDEISGQSTSDK